VLLSAIHFSFTSCFFFGSSSEPCASASTDTIGLGIYNYHANNQARIVSSTRVQIGFGADIGANQLLVRSTSSVMSAVRRHLQKRLAERGVPAYEVDNAQLEVHTFGGFRTAAEVLESQERRELSSSHAKGSANFSTAPSSISRLLGKAVKGHHNNGCSAISQLQPLPQHHGLVQQQVYNCGVRQQGTQNRLEYRRWHPFKVQDCSQVQRKS
jgi:hypothetical protein